MLDEQAQKTILEQTQKFIEILLEEQVALTSSDIEKVVRLTEEKLSQADALEKSTRPPLLQDLATLRLKINPGLPVENEELFPLMRLLEEASRLNQINGVMIEQHMKHIRLAMTHLDSITPTVRQLYGKDGLGARGSIGRSLGSA